jgi:hypothetical protein
VRPFDFKSSSLGMPFLMNSVLQCNPESLRTRSQFRNRFKSVVQYAVPSLR